MKTVMVPQMDIDAIETARLGLYELIKLIEKNKIKSNDIFIYAVNITQPMWGMSHRKYRETFLSKIRRIFIRGSQC